MRSLVVHLLFILSMIYILYQNEVDFPHLKRLSSELILVISHVRMHSYKNNVRYNLQIHVYVTCRSFNCQVHDQLGQILPKPVVRTLCFLSLIPRPVDIFWKNVSRRDNFRGQVIYPGPINQGFFYPSGCLFCDV